MLAILNSRVYYIFPHYSVAATLGGERKVGEGRGGRVEERFGGSVRVTLIS